MIRRLRLLMRPRWILLALLMLAAIFVCGRLLYAAIGEPRPEQRLILLVADGMDPSTAQVRLWTDAANETGLPLRVMHASEFLRPQLWPTKAAGIVLPDGLLRRASRSLTERLDHYVRSGGNLMVVYDAATLLQNGGDASDHRALLSDLVGVDYALYHELGTALTVREPLHGDPALLRELHVPPGKYMPVGEAGPATITAYHYGEIAYPAFVTRGRYQGRVLLAGKNGNLAAGLHRAGRGQVLFVNLPLGYLKQRTDGMLLHGFLAWYGEHVVGLPRLLSVPRGVGGLVLNWHIDSNSSLAPLQLLREQGHLFRHGPYSVHFTAGPDTYRPGDNTGLDLARNPVTQSWVKLFAARGDAIGSHGGWSHNAFAQGVNEHNGATYGPWIARNDIAVARLTGKPVTEYSSPEGHHPQWITDWLGQHGIRGYYFTGDTGMAPTRSYRDGHRSDTVTWAFPLVPYGRIASFEEATGEGIDGARMGRWLTGLVDFVAVDRSVRLFYFHPPGVMGYLGAIDDMLNAADARGKAFRWYTISGLSRFLDRRDLTTWTMSADGDGWLLQAHNPEGLDDLTWDIPASRYTEIAPVAGNVRIARIKGGWLLWAEHGQRFSVRLQAHR